MKRVPSFSARPNFPAGLQVLLVEPNTTARSAVQSQLQELSYIATPCASCAEAVALLCAGTQQFDLVLAEAKAAADACKSLLPALKGLPLVLMADTGNATTVWKSIELGAADCLEKPLSSLKLRNIWQHVVRKMMRSPEPESADNCKMSTLQKCMSVPCSPRTPSAAGSGSDLITSVSDGSTKGSKRGADASSATEATEGLMGESATADSSDSRRSTRAGSVSGSPTKRLRKSSDTGPQAIKVSAAAKTTSTTHSYSSMGSASVMHTGMNSWGMSPFGTHPQTNFPLYNTAWQMPMQQQQCCGMVYPPMGDCMPMARCNSTPPGLASSMSSMSLDSILGETDLTHSLSTTTMDSVLDSIALYDDLNKVKERADAAQEQANRALPIGLKLKKSDSLLNLINKELTNTGVRTLC